VVDEVVVGGAVVEPERLVVAALARLVRAGDERPQPHPLGLDGQGAEQGRRVECRPHALADRPQVVEHEHPVEAGGLGSASDLHRSLGVVPELRQGDAHQHGALISGPWLA
jgi:hypothetical protein